MNVKHRTTLQDTGSSYCWCVFRLGMSLSHSSPHFWDGVRLDGVKKAPSIALGSLISFSNMIQVLVKSTEHSAHTFHLPQTSQEPFCSFILTGSGEVVQLPLFLLRNYAVKDVGKRWGSGAEDVVAFSPSGFLCSLGSLCQPFSPPHSHLLLETSVFNL